MSVNAQLVQVFAPLSGVIVPLERVPDPVFAQKIVGDGVAIEPTSQTLQAPCEATIVHLHPSGHAITLETKGGVQILIHIGIDTVQLRGKGFSPKVKVGDSVRQGQALIDFDADLIAQTAKSLFTIIVASEARGGTVQLTAKAEVKAGDPLFSLNPQSTGKTTPQKTSGGHAQDEVQVNTGHGLHARPAAQLVQLAKEFQSQVTLKKGNKSANAKSLVNILNLEAQNGDRLSLIAEGPDADAALKKVRDFLQSRFEDAPKESPKAEVKPRPSSGQGEILGLIASPGLAIGYVQQWHSSDLQIAEQAQTSVSEEKQRLQSWLSQAGQDLEALAKDLKSRGHESEAKIFLAHKELLSDPGISDLADAQIERGKSAAYAWKTASENVAQQLSKLDNEMMAQRANDVRDVGRRVIKLSLAKPSAASVQSGKPARIVIAENLTPTEITEFNPKEVVGFCTTTGSKTSHVSILARSLGIPGLVGADPRVLDLADGEEIILDAEQGEIRIKPNTHEKQEIQVRREKLAERNAQALKQAHEPVRTRDGRSIHILANISSVADARRAVEMGCDGVGLLRSEFLFHGRQTPPSEDEQLKVYQDIADVLGERPLTIRTLDVGGDKPLSYLPIPKEENPFLGLRGLRVSLKYPELFRTQIRAILRVKSRGPLHVMFPMVATLNEFRQAQAIFEDERKKLGAKKLPLGIMVEIPSAALIAESFAKEADFFSIGTNDLTQYTLAADRGNQNLTVETLHPSIFRLIGMTVEAAHRNKKWVAICGDLGGDSQAVGQLLELGVDELSMTAPQIPLIKAQIREQGNSHDKNMVFVPAEDR